MSADILSMVERAKEVPKYHNVGIYNMSEKGLYALITERRGSRSVVEDRMISGPFEILGRVRDPKGEGWARLLRWHDKDKRTHTYAVSDNDLHGDHRVLFGNLASRGLHIVTSKDRDHLIHYLNSVEIEERVTEVPHTGWHSIGADLVFALPDQTIGEIHETIIIRGTDQSPFERCGTLDQWKKGIGSLTAGHSRPIFYVSAAMAAPLLGPLGIEGGGFNLFGKSSIGKTSAECAAASVWGKGTSTSGGFIRTWRATANALEAVAAIHTDTMLGLDELSVVEAKEAAASVYSLASGAGKGRSNRDGSARRSLIWRVIILSTGEVRLTDKLIEDRRKARAGQQVRLVDIPADAGKGFGVFDSAGAEGSSQILADKIKAAAQTHYGSAGPEFVRNLIAEDYSKIKQMIEAFRVHAPEGADNQVLRVLDRFGLVAAAGELAIQFGIVPWEKGEAIKAAKVCFDAWFEDRGGADAGEDLAAIAAVSFFIEKHGEARFEPAAGTADGFPIRDRAGWRRGEGDAREWLVLPEVWKQEVCAGHNPTAVAKALVERGMLKPDTEGKHSRSERIREGVKMRVYVVTSKILAGE